MSVAQNRDLQAADNKLRSTSASLTYTDECFTFQLLGVRDNTVRSAEGGDTIYFRLVFRNLGEVEAPILSGRRLERAGIILCSSVVNPSWGRWTQ